MKAAVLDQMGNIPKYGEFPDPVPQNENQVLITVKASSIKQIDKLKASGKHYTTYPQLPVVVGLDGVGMLEDGTHVYTNGITGMIAEKALVNKNKWIVLPENLDINTAAALPNALMGSAMALLYRAKMQKGDVVLVNGATGVTGKTAVQIAKYYGASKIIVTGRNAESLEQLKELGADEIISLKQDDQTFIETLKAIHKETPVDIVIDYLWGHPVELILTSFQKMPYKKIKVVTVGEMAGANITLPSGMLRSSAIDLMGSGIGSLSNEETMNYMSEILPKMFKMASEGHIQLDVEAVELKDVESAWQKETDPGKRIVVTI